MIAVCVKCVDRRPEIDPMTGAVHADSRAAGMSDADQAALEWALRLADAWGDEVVAVTAGHDDAEVVLRDALEAGATRAVRAVIDRGAPSEAVAAALAEVVRGARFVLCGDWSLDRGTGSVPPFLAAHLRVAQSLGLVTLAIEEVDVLLAERRLDGGRRERLRVRAPAVVSMEGSSAKLRRASVAAALHAKRAPIEHVTPALVESVVPVPRRTGPFRPRPRVLPPPDDHLSARERILALTGALVEREPPKRLVLDPEQAADVLLEQLREWGELPELPER